MIAKDSILRRLPANMDRKQALFFDGIRHSAEIAAFAHGRLQETLTHIATGDHSSDDADRLYTSAFLDAWSIVDAIDRFRALWSAMPGASPAVLPSGQTTFAEITQPVRDLRNVADHLAQRAEYVVARRGSALGVLSWFTAVRPDGLEGLICTIVPGTLQHGSAKVVNPAGRIMELPTGMIHLSAGEHRACLSDVMPEMTLRVRDLEAGLERGVKDLGAEHPRSGSDLLVKMSVTFHPSSGKHSLSEGEA